MKSFTLFSALALAATTVNALSSCILDCQESEATASGCSSDYNTTLCYCSADFASNVKGCIYSNGCNDDGDVNTFYTYRDSYCNGTEESTKSSDATISDTDDSLGTCVLDCQSAAAVSADCSSSNYNATSCYCDNDQFVLDVKACLYQNCSDYVSVFYNYHDGVCDTDSSSTAAASSTTAAATAASTATLTSDSTSNKSKGLDASAKAGISVGTIVGGIAIIGAIAFFLVRRRKVAAAAKRDAEIGNLPTTNVKQMDEKSISSGMTAVHSHQ